MSRPCAIAASGHEPQRSLVREHVGTRVRVNVSPDLQVAAFVQYDNESRGLFVELVLTVQHALRR